MEPIVIQKLIERLGKEINERKRLAEYYRHYENLQQIIELKEMCEELISYLREYYD